MYKKFEINRTKIKGGCQLGRKVVTHNSKSDLPLVTVCVSPAFSLLNIFFYCKHLKIVYLATYLDSFPSLIGICLGGSLLKFRIETKYLFYLLLRIMSAGVWSRG